MIVYATDRGNICGWDLRTNSPSWKIKMPAQYGLNLEGMRRLLTRLGMITATTMDLQNHSWILSGTHRGVMALWDVRFQIPIKAWLHPSKSKIHRLRTHPTYLTSKGKRVFCSAGDNEVSVWDVEKATCRELFCGRELMERPSLQEIQVS